MVFTKAPKFNIVKKNITFFGAMLQGERDNISAS